MSSGRLTNLATTLTPSGRASASTAVTRAACLARTFAALRILAGDTPFDDEVSSLDPAEPPHCLVEMTAREGFAGDNKAVAGTLRRFLRGRSPAGRRHSRHSEQGIAPSHSMTSSAR